MIARAAVLVLALALAGVCSPANPAPGADRSAGRPVDRSGDLPARAIREATEVLGQRKLLQRAVPA